MSYTGNTVYLNRRQLISNPSGNIYYLGKTWSQFGNTEQNMDIYGSPNINGAYRDSSGNGLYFPSTASSSCINLCYTYYNIGSPTYYSYLGCSSSLILATYSNGQLFCAIDGSINKIGTGSYIKAEECGDLDSTIMEYDYIQDDTTYNNSYLIITDITLGIQLLRVNYNTSGTVSVIDTHIIKVDVTIGNPSTNNATDLTIEDSVIALIDILNVENDQSYTLTVNSSRPQYNITAKSYNNI